MKTHDIYTNMKKKRHTAVLPSCPLVRMRVFPFIAIFLSLWIVSCNRPALKPTIPNASITADLEAGADSSSQTNLTATTIATYIIRTPAAVKLPATWTPVSTIVPLPTATVLVENTQTPTAVYQGGPWDFDRIPDITLTPTPSDWIPPAAQSAYENALTAYESGDHSRALEQAELALALAPENTDYLVLHGQLLIDDLFPIQGESELRRALEIDPFNAAARQVLANLYLSYGRWNEADAEYLRYLSLAPSDAEGWFSLGSVREQQGRIRDAISAYSTTLEIDPYNQDALFRRSQLWLYDGDYQSALPDISLLIDIDPSPALYQQRAKIFLDLEAPLDAELDFNEALSMTVETESAFSMMMDMGNAFLSASYPIQAADAFSKAINLYPDPEPFIGLGESYLLLNDYPDALQAFDEALKVATTDQIGRAYFGRGRAYLGLESFDLAKQDLTLALAMVGEDEQLDCLVWRSEANKGLGLLRDAITDLTQALQLEFDPILLYKRGVIYQELGNKTRAISDLTDFLELSEELFDAQVLIDDAQARIDAIKAE